MSENYVGSTAAQLDHYFGNNVGLTRLLHMSSLVTQDVEELRTGFIRGLEGTIRQNLPEYAGVTNKHLIEMLDLARTKDWTDIETIKILYRRHHQIRQKHYDEQKYFQDK